MRLTDKQFGQMFADANIINNRDAFVSDWALANIWGDAPETDIPAERIDTIAHIWDLAHTSINDIITVSGLSITNFAATYAIPYSTVQHWRSGVNTCPVYLRLLLIRSIGCYKFK